MPRGGSKRAWNPLYYPFLSPPYLYRVGELPGTREIVAHPNYVVVYRVAVNRVDTVNVLHARQEYP